LLKLRFRVVDQRDVSRLSWLS